MEPPEYIDVLDCPCEPYDDENGEHADGEGTPLYHRFGDWNGTLFEED